MLSKMSLSLIAILLAGLVSAQVYEPIRLKSGMTGQKKNTIVLQTSKFDWDVPGASGRNGWLVAGEFAAGDKFGIGFWATDDSQRAGGETVDLNWYELHFSWLLNENPQSAFGIMLGALFADVEDFDRFNWYEVGLSASFALDAKSEQPGKWVLGANFGRLIGDDTSSGSFRSRDGWSYGATLKHAISDRWSLNATYWVMDLDGSGGAKIRRVNFGVGFHF